MPRTLSSSSLRTLVGAIVLLLPATALALDNGNLGTPQNDCERIATSDYYANIDSCRRSLQGDAQATAQCEVDAAYDYQDAIAQCKKQAARSGTVGDFGKFDGVFSSSSGGTVKSKMSVKKGLLFDRS